MYLKKNKFAIYVTIAAAARGDVLVTSQRQLFSSPLRYISLSVQHETPAKNEGEMCVLRSVFV